MRFALAFLLLLCWSNTIFAQRAPLIAVTASLRQVWPALMHEYASGGEIRPSFGSSGNLLRQIKHGAPYELFLSANEDYVQALELAGLTAGQSHIYATGKLAWLAPAKSKIAPWLQPNAASEACLPDISTLAIANPAFAPYGQAAKEVLVAMSLWQRLSGSLLLGESAAQAVQFSLSGATDGGIVPLPLLYQWRNSRDVVVKPIDSALHQPINHKLTLLRNASEDSEKLVEYLLSDKAQAIFKEYGFEAVDL